MQIRGQSAIVLFMAVLLGFAASRPLVAQDARTGVKLIQVRLSEARPASRSDAALWKEERRAHADGLFLDGKRLTLRALALQVAAAGPGPVEVLVLCEPGSRCDRLLTVVDSLTSREKDRVKVYFAPSEHAEERHLLAIERLPWTSYRVVNGELVEFDNGGADLDFAEDADPADEALPAEDQFEARMERYMRRRLELYIGRSGLIFHGEEASEESLEARLEKLAEKVAAHKAGQGRSYLCMQVEEDQFCSTLAAVYATAEKSAASRILVTNSRKPSFSVVELFGGTDAEWLPSSVDRSLKALSRAQRPDGHWTPGTGSELGDVGTTALAMLAFLGEFHSPSEGDFKREVGRAWAFLVAAQRENGAIADDQEGFSFSHVLATLALIETCGLTGADEHQARAEKALAYLIRCRNEGGLWGLAAGDKRSDLMVTAWALLALRSAADCGLELPEEALEPVLPWLDGVIDEKTGAIRPTAADQAPTRLQGIVDAFFGRHAESLAAVAALARSRAGAELESDPRLAAALQRVAAAQPDANGRLGPADLDYLYFGALLMNAHGDGGWIGWHDGLNNAIREQFSALQTNGQGIRGLLGADPAKVGLLTMCLGLSYRFSRNPARGR